VFENQLIVERRVKALGMPLNRALSVTVSRGVFRTGRRLPTRAVLEAAKHRGSPRAPPKWDASMVAKAKRGKMSAEEAARVTGIPADVVQKDGRC